MRRWVLARGVKGWGAAGLYVSKRGGRAPEPPRGGRDHWRSSGPAFLLKSESRWFLSISMAETPPPLGQPVPVLSHLPVKRLLLFQFEPVASCPITGKSQARSSLQLQSLLRSSITEGTEMTPVLCPVLLPRHCPSPGPRGGNSKYFTICTNT